MIIKSLAVIGLIALTSTSVFAEKIYNCTAMRNGSSTGQTVSITVMNSQGGSDAEVKAANVFNNSGVKFDRINCKN